MSKLMGLISMVVACAVVISCAEQSKTEEVSKEPPVIEVRAIYKADTDQHLFATDADTLDAGWTTFRFINASPVVHFMLLDKYPEGRTAEDAAREVGPPFQDAMDLINEGKRNEGLAALANLPDWFADVVFRGGAGFTSPGQTSEVTIFMEPGNHVVECYIKNEKGIFHSSMGMVFDLYVTADTTGTVEPSNPTITINLSNEGFETVPEQIPAGEHLVKVNFNEKEPPLLANDVQVVKMDESSSLEEVTSWMDWTQTYGLVSTADDPHPAVFLGGVQDMPEGNSAYFRISLEPGDYAWVSERPADAPLAKRFRVIE